MKRRFEADTFGDARENGYYYLIGCISSILALSLGASVNNFRYIHAIVIPALRHNQYKLYYDYRGIPIAFVAWAKITQEVEARIVAEGALNLHPSEWNEGGRFWIVDLVAPFGNLRSVLRDLQRSVLLDHEIACYARVYHGAFIAKEVNTR